jgi:hypothetical protein
MSQNFRQGSSVADDPCVAVAELVAQIGADDLDAMLFFCSPDYDLDVLATEIKRVFPCPVIGCTSAGHIGREGFTVGGIMALGFAGGKISLTPHLITPLTECLLRVAQIAGLERDKCCGLCKRFGLLLVDGLSRSEERLASALYQSLGNIPFIGASAGDNMRFLRTCVYYDGHFLSDAAVFSVIETQVPFAVFKLQNFVPGPERLVITETVAGERLIREINGLPAAEAYAEAVGVAVADLNSAVFARHPLVLRVGGDHFLRIIRRLEPDNTLSCACAIDVGLVVSVGRPVDPVAVLNRSFGDVRRDIGVPEVIIGSDCSHRRLQFEQTGRIAEVGALLAANNVFAFSTYGEQFNAQHVNHTFTGIAIGK